jgi:hypothetical protein
LRFFEKIDGHEKFIGPNGDLIKGHILARMKVSRQVLIDNSPKSYAQLTGPRWNESKVNVIDIDLDGYNPAGFELWFRALHPDAMVDAMYTLPIEVA